MEASREPCVRRPTVPAGRSAPAGAPALALSLQRTVGNRATTRLLIQRMPAERFLRSLPDKAAERWHPDMADLLEEAISDHGELEVGRPSFDRVGFEHYAYTVGIDKRDSAFSSSRVGKLVLYLMTGAGTPPGAGSLGKLRIKGSELIYRPAFSSKTQKTVAILPGQARRHVTAWHNIRLFLNKVVAEKRQLLEAELANAEPIADPVLLAEGRELLGKRPDATFGSLGPDFGRSVMLAAYVMNSKIRNLWPGASRENSEIATFSANVGKYIEKYREHGDLVRLRKEIADYQTQSKQAETTKAQMLTAINMQNIGKLALIELLEVKRALLEIDDPQNQPVGGALSGDERRIHEMMIHYLYLGYGTSDEELRYMIRYFMRGDQTPLVVK